MIDEKWQENILTFDISYKILIDSKLLQTKFDKIDGFIRIHDRTRYLTLSGTENYDAIYGKIGYLISLKTSITYIVLTILRKSKVILMILYL